MLTRIGVIGDIHAESKHLEAALNFLQAQKLDTLLCTGDVTDGEGDVNRCCELLSAHNATTVRGNHDRWFFGHTNRGFPYTTFFKDVEEKWREWLLGLPSTIDLETVTGKLLLCHGVGDNDMRTLTPDDYGYSLQANDELNELLRSRKYRYMIGGHIHQRMVRKFEEMFVINAGTILRGWEPCFVVADFQERWAQFYDLDAESAITAAERHDFI